MNEHDMSGLGKYIPGFEFLQNLTRQAAAAGNTGAASPLPGMPPLSHWVAPTFDVEELDKRIQDLRAVHFWLDQNTKALAATIQALEVQKMTLATLKTMNVSMQDMADAFRVRPETPPPPPAAAPSAAASPAATPSAPPDADKPPVDPMQWWTALTQQFQGIATSALKDMAEHAARAADVPAPPQAPAPAPAASSRRRATAKAAAPSKPPKAAPSAPKRPRRST